MTDLTQRVYIVDDDEAVRDSISLLLETLSIPSETFPSANDFLDAYDDSFVGCLVLDIRMPGMNGLELQDRLEEIKAHLPIVFVTGHGDIPMAVEAMKKGAVDFIRKPFRDQELIDRIQQAFNLEAVERASRATVDDVKRHYEKLTPREEEVFERVAAGQSNKVVAIELGISERTVEIHRSHVMEKMASRTLADLVRSKVLLEQAER